MFGRHRARLRHTTLAAVAAVSLTGALVAATEGAAAAAPTAAPAAVSATTATTIPTTCSGLTNRIVDGQLSRYVYRGQKFTRYPIGALSFGGTVETPQAFALAQETSSQDVYFAVRTNGSLWKVTYNGTLTATQVAASGWAGIRHLAASPTGTRLYALTTSGGLYRYSISSTGALRGLGAIATTGWSGIGFISPTAPDSTFDSFVGVNKSSGALVQYLVNRSTGATTGKVLKASGWAGMKHVTVGACTGAQANSAPVIGFLDNGDAYGYFDPNAYDLNGSDLRAVGKIGSGFSGLLVD
ncbi:hypothetical protein BJ986_001521 [Phycicoccus badiiscoriae]|uniref:Uncharacterized protein n=1 Tax=Pedococcus badiiscoriae TaxID=642776 RepID=A0A852WK31_9MICO|nr:hypothetical protein [Pedococcus badiiscoriae]NYG07034.1 hypothetical protein [Pedococcus badiiscoriae]